MTIEEKILAKLDEIKSDMHVLETNINEMKDGTFKTDVVTNEKYCEIRTQTGAHLTVPGLLKWFDKGCPREDSRHVSIGDVNKWARSRNTKQPKA